MVKNILDIPYWIENNSRLGPKCYFGPKQKAKLKREEDESSSIDDDEDDGEQDAYLKKQLMWSADSREK